MWHVVVAYLWQQKGWLPTHKIQGVKTDFGMIGSSGEQRVRELARNDACIPAELRNKVEKKREGKFEYFRYRSRNEQMCRRFDAGLPASEVFSVRTNIGRRSSTFTRYKHCSIGFWESSSSISNHGLGSLGLCLDRPFFGSYTAKASS